MNYIIPILGKGERFASYKEEKPFININGLTMVERVVSPLLKNENNSIWIFCRYEYFEKLNKIFDSQRIKVIPLADTTGCAETLFLSCLHLPENESFTSIDCDTIVTEHTEELISGNKKNRVYTFTDKNKQGIFSYIVPDGDFISEIKEKNPISEIASSGIYQFENVKKYLEIYSKMKSEVLISSEFYVSKFIDFCIKNGEQFTFKNIDNGFFSVGTPFQLESYLKQNIDLKTFVFDLDRTLIYDTNENPKPIVKNVEFCNGLFELGHKIIIHTARGMKSNFNDVEAVKEKYTEKIKNILKENGIKYNELIFGKPFADIYVDDKAINSFDDLNKKSGFYSGVKFDTRFMHNISIFGDRIKKTGKGVENEIHYYKEIPKQLKKFFPKIYETKNENELLMEKIDGSCLSDLLLNLQLTKNNISDMVNSFQEIHNFTTEKKKDDWLYVGKLIERFDGNVELYKKLGVTKKEVLDLCKKIKVSKHSIIHGDSVFTNIFFNKNYDLKLIDPRGKNQNGFSIYGATCYDYAKILQSLYGYDFIINEANIPETYLSFVRDYFFDIIPYSSEELKNKTKILILSMLPLHIDRPDRISKFITLYKNII